MIVVRTSAARKQRAVDAAAETLAQRAVVPFPVLALDPRASDVDATLQRR